MLLFRHSDVLGSLAEFEMAVELDSRQYACWQRSTTCHAGEAYNMFKDGGDPEKLAAAFSNAQENDYFYASLLQDFTMNLRRNQMQQQFTYLQHVSLLLDKGLMIIWLPLPRFTVFVEIGALRDIPCSSLVK
ncbi:hypothetical protein CRYUN_Cryun09bG0176800 [Craigia yunnanensis]